MPKDEQMDLALPMMPEPKNRTPDSQPSAWPAGNRANSPADPPSARTSFARFGETCAAVAATPSKLEKVRLLADYLQSLDLETTATAAIWFTGAVFASSQNKVLQLGWALLRDAICVVGQVNQEQVHRVYLKYSDLGETAFEILEPRAQPPALSVTSVAACFQQLHAARGPSGKLPLLIRLLEQCSALEAKFLVKIVTGDLRIGLKEGLVEEAIARAGNVAPDQVRHANLRLGNIGETAALARANQLASASLVPFRPIKFMLAAPEPTAEDLWQRAKERTAREAGQTAKSAEVLLLPPTVTLWLEDKYDGVRCQLHKVGSQVALYSRDLKDITTTFHDVEDAARSIHANVILDGEIVAMRGDQVLPFAELQKRLGRRESDLFLPEEIPIKFVTFDLLWQNGKSLLDQSLRERRRLLEALAPLPGMFRLAQTTPTVSVEQIEAAFLAARQRGNEGLMAKDPESAYSPGRRGLAWLKLKRAFATLDCVVVGAEYGHGKRHKVLSDYTFAVQDEQTGELKTIGKAYSGLTDAEIQQLTLHFLSKAIRQRGRYLEVEPDTVLEIAFDRIQRSNRHTSGLALRFPRILRLRTDKTLADIDTLATARKLVS